MLACNGMKMTSSAPPNPCGKPCTPQAASVPLSIMVCTGFVRRRHPFCGPSMSNDWDSEIVTPLRTKACCLNSFLGGDEVDRAEGIVRAPPSPVPATGGDVGDDLLGVERGRGHQTGGATKTASGSLKDRFATNSFMALAVPHWSVTSGSEKS